MVESGGNTNPTESGETAATAGARLVPGSAVALVSAIAFALNMVLARIVYDSGGNIHALNLTRALAFLVCIAVWLRAEGQPMRLPRRHLLASLSLGLLLCAEMYTLLGAILFIPVALAILVMYTYPLLVAAATWMTGREPPSLPRLAALGAALAGLGLALAAPVEAPDWRGVGLAAAAAVALAALLLLGERTMEGHDNRVVMLYMTLSTAGVVALVSATAADLAWPSGTLGWFALAGTTAFYVIATFCLFTAVSMIGPLKTAAIDNTSPVWAGVFATWLIGESLTALQMAGIALVVAALIFLQIVQKPRRPMHG